MTKEKRNRYIEKKIRLRPDENNYIINKMDNAGRKNFNAFALEMLIQGQVTIVDFKTLNDLKIAIDRVGKNINQIAKKVNESGDVSKGDIDETKNLLKEIEKVVYQTIQTEYKNYRNWKLVIMVVVKTMQIKTPERLTRSVKYILNPKKTNVPYVETEKDFPVTLVLLQSFPKNLF